MRRGNYRRGAGLERRRARGPAAAVQLSITRAQTAADCAGGPNRARQAAERPATAPTESADRSARIVANPAAARRSTTTSSTACARAAEISSGCSRAAPSGTDARKRRHTRGGSTCCVTTPYCSHYAEGEECVTDAARARRRARLRPSAGEQSIHAREDGGVGERGDAGGGRRGSRGWRRLSRPRPGRDSRGGGRSLRGACVCWRSWRTGFSELRPVRAQSFGAGCAIRIARQRSRNRKSWPRGLQRNSRLNRIKPRYRRRSRSCQRRSTFMTVPREARMN